MEHSKQYICVFNGEDFDLLKLKACLMKYEIEDILDPKAVPPPNSTDKDMLLWRKACNKALGFIILSLGDTQKRKIKDEKFPLGALQILEKEYESKSKANRFLLFRKLLALQWEQGTTLAQHLDAMDRMVDRVRAVGQQVDDNIIAGVLINSLPPQYNNLIENFDILGENLTLDKVREVLQQHKQTVKIRDGDGGQIALHARTPHKPPKGTTPATNTTPTPLCTHCKGHTHTIKTCWQLHPHLCRRDRDNKEKKKELKERIKEAFVLIEDLPSEPGKWLLDSGASCHMSNDKSSFVSLRDHKVRVQVGKKDHYVVSEGVGVVELALDVGGDTQHIAIYDVLYIPDLPINLMSVAQLANRNLKVEFNKRDGCVVYNTNNLIVAVANNTGNNTYSLQL